MRILLSCLTLAAVFAHAPDARAYKAMGIKWPDAKMPIAWSLDVDGADNITTSADNDEVKRAVKAWQDVDCSKLTFGTPSVLAANQQNATGDGINKVYWFEGRTDCRNQAGQPLNPLPAGCWEYGTATLGVTTPKYSGGQIFDADIEFNGQDYNWSTGQGSYCSNCTDTFSIALHEFGHFFGLDHSSTNNAIMFASYPGSPKQTLHSDDVAGICAIYPKPQPNTVPQGGACTQTSDCVTGQGLSCATSQAGDEKICTRTCTGTSDTNCPAEYECRAASTGFACFPKQASGGEGGEDAICGQTVGGCSGSLVCVGTSGTTGTCQRACNPSAPNCPAGKTCYGTGGSTGACFPGSSGGEGDPCGSSACGSGLQCVGTSSADARCRRSCTVGAVNACPANFECERLSDNSGACLPSATPTGAAECQSCGQGVACAAGLSCVADSDGQSRCRKGCLEDNACGVSNRCIARNDVPGATAACACPGVAVDARAEGEACTDSDECAANAICIRDEASGGAACRTTCNPQAPLCEDPKICTAVGAAHICLRPVETPDAGNDGDEPVPDSCGSCASGGVEAFALLALVGALRRRRISRG